MLQRPQSPRTQTEPTEAEVTVEVATDGQDAARAHTTCRPKPATNLGLVIRRSSPTPTFARESYVGGAMGARVVAHRVAYLALLPYALTGTSPSPTGPPLGVVGSALVACVRSQAKLAAIQGQAPWTPGS